MEHWWQTWIFPWINMDKPPGYTWILRQNTPIGRRSLASWVETPAWIRVAAQHAATWSAWSMLQRTIHIHLISTYINIYQSLDYINICQHFLKWKYLETVKLTSDQHRLKETGCCLDCLRHSICRSCTRLQRGRWQQGTIPHQQEGFKEARGEI